MTEKNKMKSSGSSRFFNAVAFTILTIVALLCLLPFIMVVSGSFSENSDIIKNGYTLFPRVFSLDAYRMIFEFPEKIIQAYGVSITVTVIGTLGGLVMMSMAGYVLQRKEVKYRGTISFFIYFTTLFNSGLVPWYMLICGLGLKNSIGALILPGIQSAFSILLIRNFMKSVPESLIESAKIDGAGDFLIYRSIIVPLSKPVLATVGLFLALGYWNDWYTASLFIQDVTKYPLQFLLYKTLSSQQLANSQAAAFFQNNALPTESVKLATAVIATGPIILLYPFLQKYFVQGITIGAVKG